MSAFGLQLPEKKHFHTIALTAKFDTFSRRKLSIWKVKPGSTTRVQPLSIHYRRTFCLKNQLIRLRNLGEEAFGVALTQVKIANKRLSQFDVD